MHLSSGRVSGAGFNGVLTIDGNLGAENAATTFSPDLRLSQARSVRAFLRLPTPALSDLCGKASIPPPLCHWVAHRCPAHPGAFSRSAASRQS